MWRRVSHKPNAKGRSGLGNLAVAGEHFAVLGLVGGAGVALLGRWRGRGVGGPEGEGEEKTQHF